MATGYEVRMYADITRMADALVRIATVLEAQAQARPPEDLRADLGAMGSEELVLTIQAGLTELHRRAA